MGAMGAIGAIGAFGAPAAAASHPPWGDALFELLQLEVEMSHQFSPPFGMPQGRASRDESAGHPLQRRQP